MRSRRHGLVPGAAAAAAILLLGAGCGPRPIYRSPPSLPTVATPAPRGAVPDRETASTRDLPPPVAATGDSLEAGTVAGGDEVAEHLGAIARQWVGTPYRRGGESPRGMDCSGLAVTVFNELGVSLPRSTREQQSAGRPVGVDELAPGDLVFFRLGSSRVNHVGIALGPREFLHASRSRGVVIDRLDDAYFARRIVRARRILGEG
ncbi:MAG: C40 family peptidase [bacterium]